MSNTTKRGIAGIVIGFALIVCALFLVYGCGEQPTASPEISAACPPDAKFCPVPVAMPSLSTRPIGRLEEAVSAKVMIMNKDGSDPRVVTQDIPAGVWLVEEAE